ncbi:MAG: pitrilysin family protein [bacterium]
MFNYKITELESGIKIITENVPYVKSFALGFWFDAGSRDENAENNGICHFLEHMLFKGTKKRSSKRISEEIESLGGYLNAFTSKEHTCFYGRGLGQYFGYTFDVLADMVQNSSFKDSEIKKEANVIVDELNDVEDSPEELIFEKFEEEVYKENSLRFQILGTEKNILKFRHDDFVEHSKKMYNPANMYIISAGAVEHEKVVALTEKYLKNMTSEKQQKREEVKTKKAGNIQVVKDIQQVHLLMGKPTYGYTNPLRMKVNVLSHILGETSSSRLFQRLREKNGIAYQINSFLNSFSDLSTFGVYLSTNEKSIEKANALIKDELKKMREKLVSETELKRAKEYIKGSMIMGLESMNNRISRMANSIIYYGRIKSMEETIQAIDCVTKEEIIEAAQTELDENNMIKVVISSKDLLKKFEN